MSKSNLLKEGNRLNDIAEGYKQRGYKVTVAPPPHQLPGFLSRFQPDMIAESPDESVVIEIKSSGKARGTAYWQELSNILQQHPGWRFEFVVDPSSKRDKPETLDKNRIKQRLEEGQQLAKQGMLPASLLITWSAIEAAMRLASEDHEIDLPDWRPASVISRLYTDGVIERDDYDFLMDCMKIRNAVAHGFYEGRIRLPLLKRLQRLTVALLA